MKEGTRKAAFAGSWYPDNPAELSKQIKSFLDKVEYLNLNVKAIVVPHAGYMFSGQTAAYAFKQINKSTRKVIILGTAHRYSLNGSCVIDYDYYDSPLGKVRLSKDVKEFLSERNVFSIPEADTEEHSIEIEIPFLQTVLGDFEILPVIVGKTEHKQFSELLEKYLTNDSVIVASVDLSHFNKYNDAVKIDAHSIECILNFNSGGIRKAQIDSPYAIAALLDLAKRKDWEVKLLDYKNSGDIVSDRSSVVGYSAIVFYEVEKAEEIKEAEYFTAAEQVSMVNIAKNSAEMFVKTGKRYSETEYHSKFKESLACFVTVKTGDELRGCIGTIEPVDSLYNSLIDNAISAVSRDPRFSPVGEKELSKLNYEVSVLSPPELFDPQSLDELFEGIKGKGLIIKKDYRSAVYLPQVWEHFSDEKGFLRSLCQKAGMFVDEWKNYKDMKYYVFSLIN
ncbi:MAG: AmmeMemoRadiSam system protein B [Ignavibacteriae bacterium]|nr:AmmeMemoRadiSam system protein B [Ignavibacteriota bacterium]